MLQKSAQDKVCVLQTSCSAHELKQVTLYLSELFTAHFSAWPASHHQSDDSRESVDFHRPESRKGARSPVAKLSAAHMQNHHILGVGLHVVWTGALVKVLPGNLNVARVLGVWGEVFHSGSSVAVLVWECSRGRGSHSSVGACLSTGNALDVVVNRNGVWTGVPSNSNGGVRLGVNGSALDGFQETLIICNSGRTT